MDLTAWPADLLPPPFAAGDRPGLLDAFPRPDGAAQGCDVVVLVDGLGALQLAEHRSLTPTLRRLEGETTRIRTVAPSTTATAMVSFLTGLDPLAHGVLGYTTRDPATDRAIPQLKGAPGIDPQEWMPAANLLESSGRRGIQVGPEKHRRSHLTRVAYRGWEYAPHGRNDRVSVVRRSVRRVGPGGVVHVHLDDLDRTGHAHGVDSDAWRAALEEADAVIGALLRRLPAGTRVHVTADHGMVDLDPARTVDLADHPALERLVGTAAGETRALSLTARPAEGAARRLHEGLQDLLGEDALVLDRDELLTAGVLGPPDAEADARVAGRVPDVLVLSRGRAGADVFSRRPEAARRIVGVHGSLTPEESWVPLVRTVA